MQHPTGSPQQFCLRWNNYQTNLTNVFDQLLQSESFVDVTLACDGQSVKAHKMVLSACSPYFQSLFFDNPCQHPIVIMRDIKWPELKAVVEFMYKGEINVSQEQIGPLLKVAETLKVRGLADVNGEQDIVAPAVPPELIAKATAKPPGTPEWDSRPSDGADGAPRPKKRRRPSGERSSLSSPAESASTDMPEPPPSVEMSPAPSATPLPSQGNQEPLPLALALPQNPITTHTADDMEIKPGIAEMIREEERAKLLESSHAWLGAASTSSIADYPNLLKLKTPTWTQEKLKEAIDAVVTQKMRFTQASSRYGIPKGTLYDNILGKSKRMAVLEEAGLTSGEEAAVLDFCCDVSISPYNRRTKKSLKAVLKFVETLRKARDPEFMFTGLSGFRWWWAFCKKHSIVSLYYENNADSYQYQLQSMWQKCWNTNQSLVHNLRFRERGPLKSWRPETMAEAIFSVLKEGLSLSQAARKYDIPYPTFVLYANRVHNMLGPSADGGSDLRPKGRGRPQRILLGVWPDEHIRGVIRAVVFRDSHQIKDEHIYPRMHQMKSLPNVTNLASNFDKFVKQEKDWDSIMKTQQDNHRTQQQNCWDGVNMQNYPNNNCSNGADSNVSPGAAAAAAVAAVAQGLRQQMCSMVAAAQHQSSTHDTNPVASLVNSLALAGHCGGVSMSSNGAPPISMSHMASMRMASPANSIQDLRISPAGSGLESPISSPLGLTVSSSMEPAISMGIGNNLDVSSMGVPGMMGYNKAPRNYASPRPENLFHEELEELVKPLHGSNGGRPKDPISSIKMEPMTECRGE